MQTVNDFGEIQPKHVNPSGIVPVEYKVLVKVDSIDEVSEGGIYIPKQITEREEMAQVTGVLIDIGGNAFDDWRGLKPKPGDKVLIAKYAGSNCEGVDGEDYRICSDKDIAAILSEV